MINFRTSLLLVAALAVSTPALAEFQINPDTLKAVVDAMPTPESEHSAVVPFGPPGGDGGGSGDNSLKPGMIKGAKRDKIDITPGGGSEPADDPMIEERGPGDLALLCEIERNGDFVLVNRGSRVVPQGAKIRWKAGSEKGLLSLGTDLEPGARAMAKDQASSGDVPCLATLL